MHIIVTSMPLVLLNFRVGGAIVLFTREIYQSYGFRSSLAIPNLDPSLCISFLWPQSCIRGSATSYHTADSASMSKHDNFTPRVTITFKSLDELIQAQTPDPKSALLT